MFTFAALLGSDSSTQEKLINIEKLLFITCSEDTTRTEYEYRICKIASDERSRYKKLCQVGTDSNIGKIHQLVRVMWQSEKWKQILEKGTMWKVWNTRKLVSTGFLTC
jgi:hypothetical protein